MPQVLITAPSAEPIDLLRAKQHLHRTTGTDQDETIKMFMAAAREFAENQTQQQLIHAQYAYVLDRFPASGFLDGANLIEAANLPKFGIVLPTAPVVNVASITYTDMGGNLQTMPPANYVVRAAGWPAVITPLFGQIWPIAIPQIGAVTVTYNAGYASPMTATGSDANLTVTGPVTFAVNQVIRLSNSGGALPAGLNPMTDYYVKTVTNVSPNKNVYTVSLTQGGAAVATTDTGTGTSYIGVVPQGIVTWFLARLGAFFRNRDEVVVDTRVVVLELPYIDGLLDPYRIILA